MKKIILILTFTFALVSAYATQYSKLKLTLALKSAGRWGDFKTMLSQAGLSDEWQAAAYISDDYPDFALITNKIAASGFCSADELSTLLTASIDNGADALLGRVYASDMKTASGRMRWHGRAVSTVTDTNALVRATTYESGYVHSEPFSPPRPPSIEDQLAAAEREKRRQEAAARRKAARIAELTTNMAYHVQKTMAARHWPEDLATLYMQHELNKLIGTNTVNAIITPAP